MRVKKIVIKSVLSVTQLGSRPVQVNVRVTDICCANLSENNMHAYMDTVKF